MVLRIGTSGNDSLNGTSLIDRILGGLGNDVIRGFGGDDRISGGRGNDLISGGDGNDFIAGGAGSDRIFGGAGDDLINGGDSDRFADDEDLTVDALYGEGGSDRVVVGRSDFAFGGNGVGAIDTLVYNVDFTNPIAPTLYNVNLLAITGQTLARVGILGIRAAQFEAADVALSNARPGSILGGTNGDDELGMNISDRDSLVGGRFNGNGGDDLILGSRAGDTMLGGAGNDLLVMGARDTATGGVGADVFEFRITDVVFASPATITDFQIGVDQILLFNDRPDEREFAANVFIKGAAPVANAAGGLAQILYNTANGRLLVDDNGAQAGGVTHIATLTGRPNIGLGDVSVENGFL
jgi:Ca2+-binding RTX toxin-like protein